MNLRPNEAWEKAARLLKLCLGFNENQNHKLRKIEQKFNDDTLRHVIILTLEVNQNALVKGVGATLYEDEKPQQSLIKEINEMIN